MVRGVLSRAGLRLLDRLSRTNRQRAALTRVDHGLKEAVLAYGWRVLMLGFLGQFLFVLLIHRVLALPLWAGFLAAVVAVFAAGFYLEHNAFRLVVRHLRHRRPAVRPRQIQLAAPYERMAPVVVTAASCTECQAEPGTRHKPTCSTIPVGWFDRRPKH